MGVKSRDYENCTGNIVSRSEKKIVEIKIEPTSLEQ